MLLFMLLVIVKRYLDVLLNRSRAERGPRASVYSCLGSELLGLGDLQVGVFGKERLPYALEIRHGLLVFQRYDLHHYAFLDIHLDRKSVV